MVGETVTLGTEVGDRLATGSLETRRCAGLAPHDAEIAASRTHAPKRALRMAIRILLWGRILTGNFDSLWAGSDRYGSRSIRDRNPLRRSWAKVEEVDVRNVIAVALDESACRARNDLVAAR